MGGGGVVFASSGLVILTHSTQNCCLRESFLHSISMAGACLQEWPIMPSQDNVFQWKDNIKSRGYKNSTYCWNTVLWKHQNRVFLQKKKKSTKLHKNTKSFLKLKQWD